MARNAARCMGWIIPDQAVKFENLSATDSSYTQAGPHGGGSGTPVDTSTQAAIEVSGDQDTSIVVRVENGGLPRLSTSGVRIGYRKSSEASTAERGWECPNVVTGAGNAPIYATTDQLSVEIIALRTGTLLACYNTAGTLAMWSYNPDTNVWTQLTGANIPDTGTWSQGMAMAQDIDGTIVFIGYNTNTGTWNTYRTVAADSTTSGWTVIGHGVGSFGASPDKMRLFILPSGDWAVVQLFVTGGTPDLTISQFASDSKGAWFTTVGSIVAGSYTDQGDVIALPSGKLGLVAVGTNTDPYFNTIGSAWETFGVSASGTRVTSVNTTKNCWASMDPNGRIYVWTQEGVAKSLVFCHFSDDEGATWRKHHWPLFSAAATADADPYLATGKIVHAGGAFWMLNKAVDGVSTRSFLFFKLGGYSNVINRLGSSSPFPDDERIGSGGGDINGCSWTATSLPVAQGCWTLTSSGTRSETLTTPGQNVIQSTTTGTNYYASATVPGNQRLIGGCSFACTSGGTTATAKPGVDIIVSNGANGMRLQICATTTSFVVRDNAGVLATVNVDMTTSMQFRWALSQTNTAFEVYYKRPFDEVWALAYGTNAAATPALALSQCFWGHVGATSATTTSKWDYFWYATSGELYPWASPLSASTINARTDMMFGRLVSALPVPLGVRAATGQKVAYVRLTDGPGYVGDSWTVAPRYDHGVENLHWQGQPSPRRTWRSTQTAADESISWDLTTTQDTTLGQYIAFALLNINFASAKLQAQTHASGGWVDLATLDATKGFASLGWHRASGSDRVTVVSTSGAAGRYVQADEFVGCTVNLGGKLRRIRAHTEGTWTGDVVAVGGRAVELWLDGLDGTEGTGGFLDIWAKNAVVFLHPTIGDHYRRWRLTITAQTTYEGYFEIGNIVLGHLFVAGLFPTWSTVTAYGMNSTSSESADLVIRTKEKGPPRRTLTWDWSDGADQTGIRGTSAIPDYLTPDPSATDGIATWLDVPFKLAALLRHCKSGEIPVVACSQIPALSGATAVTVTDPSLFLYGRIAGDISLEHVQGDEGVDEVYRVAAFPVVELV